MEQKWERFVQNSFVSASVNRIIREMPNWRWKKKTVQDRKETWWRVVYTVSAKSIAIVTHFLLFWLCAPALWIWNYAITMRLKYSDPFPFSTFNLCIVIIATYLFLAGSFCSLCCGCLLGLSVWPLYKTDIFQNFVSWSTRAASQYSTVSQWLLLLVFSPLSAIFWKEQSRP